MGIGYTADTPLKVTVYGIDSVISLVDDILLEKLRKYYTKLHNLNYEEISSKTADYRANRITAYLDLIEDKINQINNVNSINSILLKYYIKNLPNSVLKAKLSNNSEVEPPYIKAVLKEWSMYLNLLNKKPVIKQIHLGGGTPTFFSVENLTYLITCITTTSKLADDYEFSFEGHPSNTSKEHLQSLFDLGFRRVCFGVQDYNETVQKEINRIQPFEEVKKVTELARKIGYISVGHDIIYGLPFQTIENVKNTIEKTKTLKPDRIAFYSYAHVPWLKGNGQRGFSEENLPSGKNKLDMYLKGKDLLKECGYMDIGMDHFAVKTDDLYKALVAKKLHRNFMGYTPSKTKVMIGLGVSSIGDTGNSFYQNVKNIEEYIDLVDNGIFPISKGHILSDQDLCIRKHILNLMCKYETKWTKEDLENTVIRKQLLNMFSLVEDELITMKNTKVKVTSKGKPFVRNICMSIDLYLGKNNSMQFSKTV